MFECKTNSSVTLKSKAESPAYKHHTHHPDHQVGEDSNPDGGQDEGGHEEFLPARLGTVWDGDEQQQEQRPRDQPLELAAKVSCRRNTH